MAWLSGYSKRKKITLTGGTSGAQTDYQLKLAVSYAAAMQGDFDDLRFTQADGTTLIDAWAEVIVTDTSATVWVEFPTTPANAVEQDYYMYYGNGSAASAWGGDATFEFWDGGEGALTVGSISDLATNATRYYHANCIVQCDNDDLLVIHQNSTGHASGSGIISSKRSTDNGANWVNSATVFDELSSSRQAISPGLGVAPNGDIVAMIQTRNLAGDSYFGLRFVISDDNGDTWGSSAWVNSSTPTEVLHISSTIITKATTMYAPIYNSDLDFYLYVSTNNGASWAHRSTMYTSGDLAEDPSYSTIVEMSNGDILWMCHQDAANKNWYRISDDDGVTWGTLTQATLSGSSIRDPDLSRVGGVYYLHGRNIGDSDFEFYTSTNGTTWSGLTEVEAMSNNRQAYSSAVTIGNDLYISFSSDIHQVQSDLRFVKITNANVLPDTSDWTTENMEITMDGTYLHFRNSVAANSGKAQRYDLTIPSHYIFEARFKQISHSTVDQLLVILADGSMTHRFSQLMCPSATAQNKWHYYTGSSLQGGDWTEGTEYIMQVIVDESNSSTGIDYRQYTTARSLLASATGKAFALGTPTETDGVCIGDWSTTKETDAYFRWMLVRKYASGPPTYAFGSEESAGHPTMRRWGGIPGMQYTGRRSW